MEIKNKSEFINADKSDIRKLSADDVVITHVNEIWDGPLDGTCTFKSEDGYYYYSIDQLAPLISGEKFPNKFLLFKLNEEQIEKTKREQDLYLNWVAEKISTSNYKKLKSSIESELIEMKQTIGWFEAVDSMQNESNFIKSYFKWKEKE